MPSTFIHKLGVVLIATYTLGYTLCDDEGEQNGLSSLDVYAPAHIGGGLAAIIRWPVVVDKTERDWNKVEKPGDPAVNERSVSTISGYIEVFDSMLGEMMEKLEGSSA